ncbi:MAG: hypothetical protein H7099_04225 [Gemmatimonadaceae bacterium]|nr:hypothetical protein [Gemmatimonadaceae bacterium]
MTIRLMAEGEFPAPDVAAARALVVMIRDLLNERAPVELLSSVDVQRRIVPAVVASSDADALGRTGRMLTAMVRKVEDSVVVIWSVRSGAQPVSMAVPTRRVITRIDDLARAAVAIADDAAQASVLGTQSMGTPPPALGSVESGNAYVYGLAEALSTTPVALRRSRASLARAAALAPNIADVWRWLARVEYSLINWNRDAGPNELKGIQINMLANARRAAKLAPRSVGSQTVVAMAHLVNGSLERAEAAAAEAIERDDGSPEVARLTAALMRVRGDDARALDHLRTAARMAPRDGPLLVELAGLARVRNEKGLACYALNAAITADEDLAPAYAMRALVRAELGDTRPAWADAETATRLGHPEWGERVGAVLDARYRDMSFATQRLRPLGGLGAAPANYLEALFIGQAAVAIAQSGFVPRLGSRWPCTELRRPALLRDFKAIGAAVVDTCAKTPALGDSAPQPTLDTSSAAAHTRGRSVRGRRAAGVRPSSRGTARVTNSGSNP